VLTGREITGLDLWGTELAALPTCETALGGPPAWRGLLSLQRCFALAGARALVLSLWRVPEPQRQEFLEDFYRRVLAGQPRAAALRDAKLALRSRYADPLYWGAFVCLGDPAALAAR
jgi:CHAT domain-containing protein